MKKVQDNEDNDSQRTNFNQIFIRFQYETVNNTHDYEYFFYTEISILLTDDIEAQTTTDRHGRELFIIYSIKNLQKKVNILLTDLMLIRNIKNTTPLFSNDRECEFHDYEYMFYLFCTEKHILNTRDTERLTTTDRLGTQLRSFFY